MTNTETPLPVATDETRSECIARLRAIQHDGDHRRAAIEAVVALQRFPADRDLLLLRATSLRFLGDIEGALAILDRLAADQPGFSLIHQERGLCHVVRRDAPAAIAAFRAAVGINPALAQSWHMLASLSRMVGDDDAAQEAKSQALALQSLPYPIVQATSLFADSDWMGAEALMRRFLLDHGDHPEAMRLLAKIGLSQDVLDDAETLYAAVLAMVPDHRAARYEYAQTLLARHKFAEAGAVLAALLAEDGDNLALREMAATIAVGLGQTDEAIRLYEEIRAALPDDPGADAGLRAHLADIELWRGHALKTVGRLPDAIAVYRTAVTLRPDFGDGWWSLANLKTYRFPAGDLATMRAAQAAPGTSDVDRVHLSFALGKALEDAGDAAGAWTHYARGNALQRASSHYRPDMLETNTAEQKRVGTPAFFAARADFGAPAPDPIFVVGLPRSGSTLIEQILASHPQVEGTQELPDIQRIVQELQGRDSDLDRPRYPAVLADLDRDRARALGDAYLAGTRAHRVLDRPFFVDKMPNNFRHIGLIHLILPNAKIIDVRRSPMACCFSNLKQLFARGQEFTYSIDDIARYYRTYLDLMRHWEAVLPGRVLKVVHEDVIDDLNGQVRRLLEYCGLAFDPACLDFHQNRRAVRTPSSEQVRQPIFRDGLDQWRAFEPWLADLRSALGESADAWRT
jgi:tetratricopeptide (TPR) repeat protein